jgi:hypothetical protein
MTEFIALMRAVNVGGIHRQRGDCSVEDASSAFPPCGGRWPEGPDEGCWPNAIMGELEPRLADASGWKPSRVSQLSVIKLGALTAKAADPGPEHGR